ncbi:hypothetical protein ACFSQQ_40565 [Mesorhizobium kowhaii]|uniref:hypothetical protein n=1 Tax=Mesorhizobium kowhaii TaxID=1300272 RepID=UPI0035ECF228
MRRFANSFFAGIILVYGFSGQAYAGSAKSTPGSVTLPALGQCISHRDTAQRLELTGRLAKDQYLYVLWGEIDDGSIQNYGEPQLVTSLNPQEAMRPVKVFLIDANKYSEGWYAYLPPAKVKMAIQYYNRGYTPSEFQVTLCAGNSLTASPPIPALVP